MDRGESKIVFVCGRSPGCSDCAPSPMLECTTLISANTNASGGNPLPLCVAIPKPPRISRSGAVQFSAAFVQQRASFILSWTGLALPSKPKRIHIRWHQRWLARFARRGRLVICQWLTALSCASTFCSLLCEMLIILLQLLSRFSCVDVRISSVLFCNA